MRYRIEAWIHDPKGTQNTDGYDIAPYFGADGWAVLNTEYETLEEAEAVAHSTYLGPDMYGIGCKWEIKEA